MKNNTKNSMIFIGVLGVLLGRIANRSISKYFYIDGSNTIMVAVCICLISIILILLLKRLYLEVVWFILISLPMFIGAIGIYLDDTSLIGLGIVLIFIIYPILIKIAPKLKK